MRLPGWIARQRRKRRIPRHRHSGKKMRNVIWTGVDRNCSWRNFRIFLRANRQRAYEAESYR
jgi:hypothetical protein